MRITGGTFGGLNLRVPKDDRIRPTQDRVREALFSMLQNDIPGCDFLDLFAGTGSAGLEALSRGARSATFVEADGAHLAILRENAKFCLKNSSQSRTTMIRADVYRWIASYSGPGFSVVFADPPYALGESRGYASVLSTLAAKGVVIPGGLFIAEMTAVQKAEETPGWELIKDRTYGKTRISIWRRGQSNQVEAETVHEQ
jgi:16S rRNA (guanine966-N2)-methyltransferase